MYLVTCYCGTVNDFVRNHNPFTCGSATANCIITVFDDEQHFYLYERKGKKKRGKTDKRYPIHIFLLQKNSRKKVLYGLKEVVYVFSGELYVSCKVHH